MMLRCVPAYALLLSLMLAACSDNETQTPTTEQKSAPPSRERIVVLGGPLAEIVYGLGAGGDVVGADVTCTYPAEVAAVTKVGYQRTIAAEQVLALNPTLVIASDEAGPPAAIEQLRSAGVRMEVIPGGHTPEAARAKIATVARLLGREGEGRRLTDSLNHDLAAYAPDSGAPDSGKAPRVIYLHSRGGGNMYAAGTETSADAIIRLAGGVNAVSGYSGYRPFTPEAGLEAAPDYIMVSGPVLQQLGGSGALLRVPGIAGTPAAAGGKVIPVDDLYMLGFGPRLGKARSDLARALRGETRKVSK